VFGLLTWKAVVLDGVVAVAARVPPLTRSALHFDVAAIVFAAEALLLVLGLVRRRPPLGVVGEPLDRRKGWGKVLLG